MTMVSTTRAGERRLPPPLMSPGPGYARASSFTSLRGQPAFPGQPSPQRSPFEQPSSLSCFVSAARSAPRSSALPSPKDSEWPSQDAGKPVAAGNPRSEVLGGGGEAPGGHERRGLPVAIGPRGLRARISPRPVRAGKQNESK